MPLVMMLMHAYGRFVHRPEPQTWTELAFVPPLDAAAPSAPAAGTTRAR